MRYSKLLFTGAATLLAGVASANASGFATYFAVVGATGAVGISSGVHSAANTAVGKYTVTFNRPVNTCAHVGSVRGPGFASVIAHGASAIIVNTYATNGVAANRAFDVIVSCAP